MLSKDSLISLNQQMLSLGAPVEDDFMGYNKPDFSVMLPLSSLPSITDKQAYGIVYTLNNYKNTQLSEIKNEIEETLQFYKELFKDTILDRKDFHNAETDYKKENGIKDTIELVNILEKGCVIHFDGYVQEAVDYKNAHWQDVRMIKDDNGVWNMQISFDRLKDFMEIMEDSGKVGFIPSENLKEVINNVDGYLAILRQKDAEPIHCSLISESSKLCILEFNKNDYKFTSVLFENKALLENIDYRSSSKWTSVTINPDKIVSFINTLKENKTFLFEFDESINRFIDKQKNQNKSDYSLLDISTLDLPFAPYGYQLEDAQETIKTPRRLLGHDMGCGKTFISVLLGSSIPEPKLVIVPESLRLNWKKEILMIDPDAEISVLYSDKPINLSKDWNIVGYNTAGKFLNELLRANFNVVFVDEAHNCKAVNNFGLPTSKRAMAVMELTEKAKYCYLLTGTPIPTRNKDLYNILKMLKSPEAERFSDYGKKFCDGFNNGFGWDFSGNSRSDELHDCLQPLMVRRLKTDVLPNLTKQRMFIPLEASSKKYKDIEYRMENCEDNDTFMGLAMTGRRYLSEKKVVSMIEMAESMVEAGESVVLVSEFTDTIQKIKDYFKDNCCTVVGGMKDTEKQQAIDDFQSGNKMVCAINTVAGGVGITLTKAHNMIICDFNWTPAMMIQVEDRICRAGQTEGCNIYYLYAEDAKLDQIFVDMITSKNGNIDKVVDNAENQMNLVNDAKENSVSFFELLKNEFSKKQIPTFLEPVVHGDKGKIEKLSKLNNPDTFWDDVRKYTKSVTSDSAIKRWQILSELRFDEIQNKDNKDYSDAEIER